jgi:hypothetical protein
MVVLASNEYYHHNLVTEFHLLIWGFSLSPKTYNPPYNPVQVMTRAKDEGIIFLDGTGPTYLHRQYAFNLLL